MKGKRIGGARALLHRVPILPTAIMVKYEPLDPAMLPDTTAEDGGATGAYRHVQLGKD